MVIFLTFNKYLPAGYDTITGKFSLASFVAEHIDNNLTHRVSLTRSKRSLKLNFAMHRKYDPLADCILVVYSQSRPQGLFSLSILNRSERKTS